MEFFKEVGIKKKLFVVFFIILLIENFLLLIFLQGFYVFLQECSVFSFTNDSAWSFFKGGALSIYSKKDVLIFCMLFFALFSIFMANVACSFILKPFREIAASLKLNSTGDVFSKYKYNSNDAVGGVIRLFSAFMKKFKIYSDSISQLLARHQDVEVVLKKNEHRLQTILETSNQGFWEVDFQGIVLDVNKSAAIMFGFDKTEIVGKHVSCFFYQDELAVFMNYLEEQKKGITGSCELMIKSNDNRKVYCLFNFAPLVDENNNVVSSCSMILDISERKKIEDELYCLNKDLEMRVKKRTEELERTLEDFQSAQKQVLLFDKQKMIQSEKMLALGSLVAGVAHEINTPMGVGVTAASFLHEKTMNFLDLQKNGAIRKSDFQQYLKVADESSGLILSNLKRASDLIRSFKLVAVDQSTEKSRKFFVKKYLGDVLVSLGPNLRKANLDVVVKCERDFEIYSDPGVYSQIITNFVMNSIMHGFPTKKKGRIVLVIKKTNDKMFLTYEDNGCGIGPDIIDKIFDPFFTTKRGKGGSGLGMHIVYNLVVQMLQGSIECKSVVGEKTVFNIEIPIN